MSFTTEMFGREKLNRRHARRLGSNLEFKGRTRVFEIKAKEHHPAQKAQGKRIPRCRNGDWPWQVSWMLRGNILNQTGESGLDLDLPLAVLGGTLTKFTETFGSNKFNLIECTTSPGSDRSPREAGKYTMTDSSVESRLMRFFESITFRQSTT